MTGFPRNPDTKIHIRPVPLKKGFTLKKHFFLNRHRAPAQKPVLTQTAAKSYSRLALRREKKFRLSASAALKSLLCAHTLNIILFMRAVIFFLALSLTSPAGVCS